MNIETELIDARQMGRSFATDIDLTLPLRPRLIPELMVVATEDDGLMFFGAEAPQVLRGRSIARLRTLLPLFDGDHTLDEIVALAPGRRRSEIHDIVSLLFSRGLLEDGRPDPPIPPRLAEVAAFLGRHVDVSRRHPNRQAALEQLGAASVCILGPVHLARQLADALTEAGVVDVQVGLEGVDRAALVIAVSTGDDVAPPSLRPRSGARMLLVRLGADEGQIGPLLEGGVTACPTCIARAHPHPAGVPAPVQAELWIGMAALFAFLALSGLPSGVALRGFRVQRLRDGHLTEETRIPVRLPGCPDCSIAGAPWAPDDPRLLPWIYHCGTSIPSRAVISPKDHQGHYLVANARLATRDERMLWSADTVPAAKPASAGGEDGTIDVDDLAALLTRVAGDVVEDGVRRRLVPTGGNLGSVRLWVVARSVRGLANGAYLYDPHRDALDFVRCVEDDALQAALGPGAVLPDCVVMGAGALAKCAQKYQSFAYRLVHLDAGVALAYCHLAAGALGLPLVEYPDFALDLPQAFGVPPRWEIPLPTFAIGIGRTTAARPVAAAAAVSPADPVPPIAPRDYSFDMLSKLLDAAALPPARPSPPGIGADPRPPDWAPSLDTLDRVMMTRRACRDYGRAVVTTDDVIAVLDAAYDMLDRRRAAGAARSIIRPVVGFRVATDTIPAGLYEFDRASPSLRRCGDFDQRIAVECSNQRSLAAAPVSILFIANLREAIDARGARGYSELAVAAGAASGAAWLRLTALGMVGTAAGGVIAGGLRDAAGFDGFHDCPLLAVHFGLPVESRRA